MTDEKTLVVVLCEESPLLVSPDVQDNLDEDSLYTAMMAVYAKYKSPLRGSYSKEEWDLLDSEMKKRVKAMEDFWSFPDIQDQAEGVVCCE
jgi:hypothetical protein